jgi:hypothetical protein
VSKILLPWWKSPGGSSISFGLATTGTNSGVSSGCTVTFSSAGAPGTWIYLLITDNTSTSNSITGGTNAWTRIYYNGTNNAMWVHKCATSEPTSYTISWTGSSKNDVIYTGAVQILGANGTNPDAYNSYNSFSGAAVSASPTATSSATTDAAIISIWTSATPPSGYSTLVTTTSQLTIAGKLNVGAGLITPGNWSASGTTLGTVLFKA